MLPRLSWKANSTLPSATRPLTGEPGASRSSSAAVSVNSVNGAVSATSRERQISLGFCATFGSVPKMYTPRWSPLAAPSKVTRTARSCGPLMLSMPIASCGSEVIAPPTGAPKGALR